MKRAIILKDLKRNKLINVILTLFILLSAFLMSVAMIVTIQLFQSIDAMYDVAKPPHFMQMHLGEIDTQTLDEFTDQFDYVRASQASEMVNIFSGNIEIHPQKGTAYSLSESLIDMGMVKQSKAFDFLLDTNNQVLMVEDGTIGVPLLIKNAFGIELGDEIVIKDEDFMMRLTVVAFVRDPQMNSPLVSSTRYLLSDNDFERLKSETGTIETLIQFLLDDSSRAKEFQTAYELADMPSNGQGVTYTIIRLLSGFADLIMVVLLVLVSIVLVLIVFLCMNFTIHSVMEEEVMTIGTMKAIGMSHKDIRALYLLKYRVLTVIGCLSGYGLALVSSRAFTAHISQTFGKPRLTLIAVAVPIVSVCIVYGVELFFAKKALKKLKKVSVIESLRGEGTEGLSGLRSWHKKLSLFTLRLMPLSLSLSIRRILVNGKAWVMMAFIFMLSTIMILIPLNLLTTFRSPDFIAYMGQSRHDIMILFNNSDEILDYYNIVTNVLDNDRDVSAYRLEARVRLEVLNQDNQWDYLYVDHAGVFSAELKYQEGSMPLKDDDIALSYLNALALDVQVGDRIEMMIDGIRVSAVVSGIYQDVTSGGYTAKMVRPYVLESVERFAFLVDVEEGVSLTSKVSDYQTAMGQAVKVTDMATYINQTFGGVVMQTQRAFIAIAGIVLALVGLVTLLFMKLQTIKDKASNGAMKAIGFSVFALRGQYLVKVSIMAILGVLVGTLLANLLGDFAVGWILSSVGFGVSRITFIINPFAAYFMMPGVMIATTLGLTWISTHVLKKIKIMDSINE